RYAGQVCHMSFSYFLRCVIERYPTGQGSITVIINPVIFRDIQSFDLKCAVLDLFLMIIESSPGPLTPLHHLISVKIQEFVKGLLSLTDKNDVKDFCNRLWVEKTADTSGNQKRLAMVSCGGTGRNPCKVQYPQNIRVV